MPSSVNGSPTSPFFAASCAAFSLGVSPINLLRDGIFIFLGAAWGGVSGLYSCLGSATFGAAGVTFGATGVGTACTGLGACVVEVGCAVAGAALPVARWQSLIKVNSTNK